jgi:RNA polymerase sigma factor (sigma-70 family)
MIRFRTQTGDRSGVMSTPRPESPEAVRIEQHLGLAYTIARRYRVTGVDIDDLMQEAALGMLRARETYDPAIASWGTYAGLWIKQHARRYLQNHGTTVRVPVYLQDRRRKAGEPPRAMVHSLNLPGRGHDGLECGELINLLAAPEPEDDDTRECVPSGTTIESLIAGTPALTENEISTLRGRAKGLRLDDIGKELSLSRERIRQLELLAMVKVREAHGLKVDDGIEQRHARLRMPDKALKVEVTDDVEREGARLRGQGLGLRAVGERVGISHRAVRQIERKLLARLSEALETAA